MFHNTGNAAENLKVRFPLNGDEQTHGSGQNYIPMIQDLTALINGQPLAIRVVEDNDPNAPQFFLGYSSIIYWSEFEVDFPVGKDVKLIVKYTLQPTVEDSHAFIKYLLATGAGWKGPIGEADVVLRFPYILNAYNLDFFDDLSTNNYFNNDTFPNSQGVRSTKVVENELWLHYEDLEPNSGDNLGVSIVQPHLWQAVMQRRAQVIDSPDDAIGWLALARSYADAGQEKHGMFPNGQLCQAFIQAFERALTLNPNDASLHAEFAQDMLMANLGGWNDYYKAISLNELATALTLDPTNAKAMSAFVTMNQMFPGTILPTPGPFPIYMTSTPTLTPTAIPTSYLPSPTPKSTSTLIPSSTPPQPPQLPTQEPKGTYFRLPGLIFLLTIVFVAGTTSGLLINRFRSK
ncbi:MAG: hypothetical protein ABSF99_02930 [Anaerolineales bacterium]